MYLTDEQVEQYREWERKDRELTNQEAVEEASRARANYPDAPVSVKNPDIWTVEDRAEHERRARIHELGEAARYALNNSGEAGTTVRYESL